MKYTSFAHWLSIGAARYGDEMCIVKGKDDASLIETYMSSKKRLLNNDDPTIHDSLERNWISIREIFEKFDFCPFDDRVGVLFDVL